MERPSPSQTDTPFREQHLEFQYFSQELMLIHGHNEAVLKGHESRPPRVFAELALASLALERFLRIIPGANPSDRETLNGLLERLSGRRVGIIRIADREQAIARVNKARRDFVHGRFEGTDATRLAGLAQGLVRFTDLIVAQIDAKLGTPVSGAPAATFIPTTGGRPLARGIGTPELELEAVRANNRRCAHTNDHRQLAMLAEGALAVAVLERCCRRALPAARFDPNDRFPDVLRKAVIGPSPVLSLDADAPEDAVARIVAVRNTLAHANYEQAVLSSRSTSTREYFGSGEYISDSGFALFVA
jgi:hypothetical protein